MTTLALSSIFMKNKEGRYTVSTVYTLQQFNMENSKPTDYQNMGEIATSDRQITLYYSSESSIAKQTLAYAKGEGLALQSIDVLETKLTGTQLTELAQKLNLKVADLVNTEHPTYTEHFDQHDFSTDDWITMITKHPSILKGPIALRGDKCILVKTPTDIVNI